MEEKIAAMLEKYSNEQIGAFVTSFFRIRFTQEELDQIMPIVRSEWKNALNPDNRKDILEKVEKATSKQTMAKVNQIIDIVTNYYGFKI